MLRGRLRSSSGWWFDETKYPDRFLVLRRTVAGLRAGSFSSPLLSRGSPASLLCRSHASGLQVRQARNRTRLRHATGSGLCRGSAQVRAQLRHVLLLRRLAFFAFQNGGDDRSFSLFTGVFGGCVAGGIARGSILPTISRASPTSREPPVRSRLHHGG